MANRTMKTTANSLAAIPGALVLVGAGKMGSAMLDGAVKNSVLCAITVPPCVSSMRRKQSDAVGQSAAASACV